jgi:hypothetical protein
MPTSSDTRFDPGADAVERLARELHDAVGRGELAVDAGAAILAEAGKGTAVHSDDVVLITRAIGHRMGISGEAERDLLAAAQLHDIGKAWVPKAMLDKPGPLTDEEWEVMRQHTVVGEQILSSVKGLKEVGRLVRHSHERWDGGGYPDGLAGSDIPLGSRIIFCADAFHAIRSDRPYRAGRPAREAAAEVGRCAGTQFDPKVAEALERMVGDPNRRPRGAGSSRLLALLMCLVVAGAGTAVARSGLMNELPTHPELANHAAPPGCGTAACPGVAGPVGGLKAVGGPLGVPGPRPVSPGLPGQRHRHKHGPKARADHGKAGPGRAKKDSGNHGQGNRGKSAAAHAARGTHGNGNGRGHSSESSGASHSSGYTGSQGSSSPGGGGGHSSSHAGGGHPSSSSHGSSHGSSSHGSSSHGSSHGNSSHGGSVAGGSQGNGNAGGNGGGNGK